ncbi:MAG TPA: FAD-binding oxidoreductase [Pseudonocardiaceae bacterium]|nr:FAD-binding oxidoreductase [Pseudonocardiaceae bacterium]
MTEPIAHTLRGTWTAEPHPLPAHALRWLRARIGLSASDAGIARDSKRTVAPSALPADAEAALADVISADNVRTDQESRLGRSGGLSYLDLIRYRQGGQLTAPDAVLTPADSTQITEILRTCAKFGIGVVPFGGGTSVVGGVSALRGDKVAVVALDLVRLDALVSVDPVSRLATFQAGVRGPDAERLLAAHGLTLGHLPQSFERATIGGFAATRSAGQASAGYGRFEDMVDAVRVATPRGEWRLGVAPASAAGPDLLGLVLGSEGAFGVLTEVTVRVRPKPSQTRYAAYVFDGWARGTAAVRALAQHRVLATVTRLSDVDETDVALAMSGGMKTRALRAYLRLRGIKEPCLLVLGREDDGAPNKVARRVLRAHRPIALGAAPARAWQRGRFAGPRQRDALLDAGVCVETLETATHWSNLDHLRDAVRAALRTVSDRPLVMCHISHAYETGASLYFTVLAPRSADPIDQWQRAKRAASTAITGARGTITHHHAVGVDHAPYLDAEIGDLGVEVLAAVKRTLDPTGILNPGKLISRS